MTEFQIEEIMDSMRCGQFSQAVEQLKRTGKTSTILVNLVTLLDDAQSAEDTRLVKKLMVLLAQDVRK